MLETKVKKAVILKQFKLLNKVVVQFNMVAEKTKILDSSLPATHSQNYLHMLGALDIEKELASR